MRSSALALAAIVAMISPYAPTALAQSAARANEKGANGAVVAPTGPGTYERFVRNQSECARYEEATPSWSASGQFLGLVCRTTYAGG